MSLLQRYIFRQALWPLLISLAGLSVLALLTQSLSTLELVVKNRQSAGTFFWITVLALPQLISIILPLAVMLASLYALNRLNSDSELIVARATGISPWNIATPILRLAALAAIVHLVTNLFLQPASYREMRQSLLDVRTDIASKMVSPGEFAQPVSGLTLYGQTIEPDGTITNVIIHDERDAQETVTYIAQQGRIIRSSSGSFLRLQKGTIQERPSEAGLDVIAFDEHQVDLSDAVAEDTVLRLKKSDKYLHELIYPKGSDRQRTHEYRAEAHTRLSSPLYCLALALIALVSLARGRHRRMGYGQKIAVAAATGFVLRLMGFSISSAAESNAGLNALQYALPAAVCVICAAILTTRKRRLTQPRSFQADVIPA